MGMTLKEAVFAALKECQEHLSETSQSSWSAHAKRILEHWNDDSKMIGDLTRLEIQEWVNKRKRVIAPASVEHELAFFSRVYRAAEDAGLDLTCPLPRVRRPRVDNRRNRLPSAEELSIIQDAMDAWQYSLVDFSMNTLMRRLEVWNLRVSDITLRKAALVINPETGKEHQLYVGTARIRTSKNGKGRNCKLNYQAAEVARRWIERSDRGENEYLFFFEGLPENRAKAARAWTAKFWTALLKRLKIKNLHWHDLRHLGATLAYLNGAKIEHISKLLGHATIQMTERYLHLDDEEMWGAAIAISKGFTALSTVRQQLLEYAPMLGGTLL